MNKQTILDRLKPRITEYDGYHLASLSLEDRTKLIGSINAATKDEDRFNMEVSLIIASLCDEKGKLIFTEVDCAEIQKLDAKSLDQLASKIIELNAMSVPDEAKKN